MPIRSRWRTAGRRSRSRSIRAARHRREPDRLRLVVPAAKRREARRRRPDRGRVVALRCQGRRGSICAPRPCSTARPARSRWRRTRRSLWYVTIPEGAHLVATIGGKGCKVEVKARAGDDTLRRRRCSGQTRRTRSDEARRQGRRGWRSPRAIARRPRSKRRGSRCTAPRRRRCRESAPPKYIILWVMDALRADKVPMFTPGARAQTPNLDELAKTSAVFRQYYVQGNESQTSHSSMWTALYPAVHNVRMAGKSGKWQDRQGVPADRDEARRRRLLHRGRHRQRLRQRLTAATRAASRSSAT